MIKLKLILTQWLVSITRKLQNNFYLYLCALLSVLILLDASLFHIGENMRNRAFDLMVKNRIVKAKVDPDIVIVDINEASLNAMAKEYGRWPWPRQVFGEFVENIENQHPKAIVFDILFSDADVYNPDSDTYFNDVIAGTNNTFFPMLRLSPVSDNLSKITPDMIPGIKRQFKNVDGEPVSVVKKPIAIVLPHFEAALNSKRLGTHNIYADADGIAREYRLWHNENGWLLPSLPLAVGNFAQMNSLPPPQDMLINWRGKAFTYPYVSFSDVYADVASKVKKRAPKEFTNKIVIIGSTAPSLFDIKATAMAKEFPGVEILATAIDNVKHVDYLHVWRGTTPYVLMSLLLIWLTALAFYRNVDRDKVTKVFSSSQITLLALSYIALNFTNTYLDITGPITWAIMYFSVAKIYALANDRAMQRLLANDIESGKKGAAILLMPIVIDSEVPFSDSMLKMLQNNITQRCTLPATVEILKGTQSGIWGLFTDMITVSWAYQHDNAIEAEKVKADATHLGLQLKTILQNTGMPNDTTVRYIQHIGVLNAEKAMDSQWRGLFAQAIIKLDILEN
ncbi:CHASE2 domain-containing protein [Methylotenera versatilis]|uniref:Putative Chase2 sensor protein n=1 Tax=Methylotenera versatilis (strain 301) TaxID=666681 RepID=D7DHS2_METV0|nr:CHASE2 domain-containing protein [Methylotenera versatilis]ADI29607.1 putative Chase2 sensor protein [Methylotenera versatilis 301]